MDTPAGMVDEHNPGVINHRISLAGHLDGFPIRGPAEQHIDAGRCLNWATLRDPAKDYCKGYFRRRGLTKMWCGSCTADTEEEAEKEYHSPLTGVVVGEFQCLRCCRMRGHFVSGYRRPAYCACHYCQHHPIPIIRHSYDLEMEMTGTC